MKSFTDEELRTSYVTLLSPWIISWASIGGIYFNYDKIVGLITFMLGIFCVYA